MIANFFNKSKPINFLALSVLLFLIYTISAISVFTGKISLEYFLGKSYYFTILLFMLFILNFIIRKNMLTDDNTYALFLYTIMFGFFPISTENSNLILANFFLLLSFRKIYSLRSPLSSIEKSFDGGFWIGLACLFYNWSFLYLLLIFSAVLFFSKNDWRKVLIPVIGFITPIFLFFVYYFATDNLNSFYEIYYLDDSFNFSNFNQKRYILPIFFLVILTLVSVFPMFKKWLVAKKDFRNTWIVINIHIIIASTIVILSPLKDGSEFIFLFMPLSILFANELQNIKKYWIKESILYFFIVVYMLVYLI